MFDFESKTFELKHVELLKAVMSGSTSWEHAVENYGRALDFLTCSAKAVAEIAEREKSVKTREEELAELIEKAREKFENPYGPENPISEKWANEFELGMQETFGGINALPEFKWPVMEEVWQYMKIVREEKYRIPDDNETGGAMERELMAKAVELGRSIDRFFRGAIRGYALRETGGSK